MNDINSVVDGMKGHWDPQFHGDPHSLQNFPGAADARLMSDVPAVAVASFAAVPAACFAAAAAAPAVASFAAFAVAAACVAAATVAAAAAAADKQLLVLY